jgi:hypothetical protein
VDVLEEDLRGWQFIVVEVCVYVWLLYILKTLCNLLVICFTTDTLTSEDTLINITTENMRPKMRASQRDTSTPNKRVIDKISRLHLTLISHQESKLMVCRCGTKIRS